MITTSGDVATPPTGGELLERLRRDWRAAVDTQERERIAALGRAVTVLVEAGMTDGPDAR